MALGFTAISVLLGSIEDRLQTQLEHLGLPPADLQTRTAAYLLSWISSLLAHPANFPLAKLHNLISQFLLIIILSLYTQTIGSVSLTNLTNTMAYKCYRFLWVPLSEKVWETLLVLFRDLIMAFLISGF